MVTIVSAPGICLAPQKIVVSLCLDNRVLQPTTGIATNHLWDMSP